MNARKTKIRRLLFILLIATLLLPSSALSSAKFIKTLLGKDPKNDANPASVDILKVYIANNGTHFRFIIKCRAKPEPSLVRAYVVWLDTKDDDLFDYCLVAEGKSGLYEVKIEGNSIELEYIAPIEVKIKGKSIYMTANLNDIEYPTGVKSTVGIVATTQQPLLKVRDRAPDSDRYYVDHEVIPELPGFTPFIFIPSVMFSIYIIYRCKFKGKKDAEV